jgi:hypothetical protein
VKRRARNLLVLLGLALAGLPAAAAVVAESEPNGRGTPDPVPATGLAPFASVYPNGSVLVTGTLAAGDADFYSLQLSAGQLLLVGAFDEQGGELTDARIGVFFEAPSANDPNDAPEAEKDDGGPGFLSRLAVPIAQSGTWKVGVTGFRDRSYTGEHLEARSGPVAYRLALAVTTASPPRVETEPANDAAATGDLLPPGGGVLRGALAPGDVDWSAIELAAGEDATVSVFDLATGALESPAGELSDTRLRLADAAALVVASNDDGGPGFLSNAAHTPAAGRHRIGVTGHRDFDYDGDHLTGPVDYVLVVAAKGRCDVNADGFIDQSDVNAVLAARGQAASGPTDARDNDGSGAIDVLDSRACALQCAKPRCQPQVVAGCGLLGLELLLPVWLVRRRQKRRSS